MTARAAPAGGQAFAHQFGIGVLVSSDPVQRFTDTSANIDRIERFTKGLNAVTFAENDQVAFAVKYALMIISEATAKPRDTAADLRPDISWREIRGLGIITTLLTWHISGY